MAKIFYEVRQNKNAKSSIKGKWFAHSKSVETMNTRKLAKHISEHGSVYTTDVEVPQLSGGDAAGVEACEDRRSGHLLYHHRE